LGELLKLDLKIVAMDCDGDTQSCNKNNNGEDFDNEIKPKAIFEKENNE
jgi:hypothetical protein